MRKVQSSNLAGYEWTPYQDEPPYDDGGTLRVEFKNGRTYDYAGVPGEVADALDDLADQGGSVGSFFSAQIRNSFPATEVTE